MLASFPSLAWSPPPNSIPTVALLPGLRLACLMASPCSLDFCDSTRVSIIYWLVRAQPPYSWLLSRLMRSMPGKPVLQQDHGVRVGPHSVATHTGQRNWTNEVPKGKTHELKSFGGAWVQQTQISGVKKQESFLPIRVQHELKQMIATYKLITRHGYAPGSYLSATWCLGAFVQFEGKPLAQSSNPALY